MILTHEVSLGSEVDSFLKESVLGGEFGHSDKYGGIRSKEGKTPINYIFEKELL